MAKFNHVKLSCDTNGIARLLAKKLPKETLAVILECFVSSDNDDSLDDDEAEFACGLFDSLVEMVDEETIKMAQGEI